MKKILIIITLVLITPSITFATSGTCSFHGGINCNAMSDWDGSAICNDGWRDSSETFYSALVCKESHHLCTLIESNQLDQKNNVEALRQKITDISNQASSLNKETMSSNNANVLRQNALKSLQLASEMDVASADFNNASNQSKQECWSIGDKAYAIAVADSYKKQLDFYKEQTTNQEPKEPINCPANSSYTNGSCNCSVGYQISINHMSCELIPAKMITENGVKNISNITKKDISKDIKNTTSSKLLNKINNTSINSLNSDTNSSEKTEVVQFPIPKLITKINWYQKILNWFKN